MKSLRLVHRILLGLLMLVPGLLKLFVIGAEGVTGMMSGIALFSWAPAFWAWVLIFFEIGSGLAILGSWKLKYTTIFPSIILFIATITVGINWSALGQTGWSNVLLHLVAVSNYLLLGTQEEKK